MKSLPTNTRTGKMHRLLMRAAFVLALLSAFDDHPILFAQEVYFSNGAKAMDVTSTEATAWTRLCASEKPNPIVHGRLQKVFRHPIGFNEEMPVERMDGGVPGATGEVRFILRGKNLKVSSGWIKAQQEHDFTAFHHFQGLKPDNIYKLIVEGRASRSGRIHRQESSFRTLPDSGMRKELYITTSTCQYFWSYDDSLKGFRTYTSMASQKPDLFVQTGDYVYYDKPGPMATNLEKARHKWHAMDGWTSLREFFSKTAIWMLKDDHDLLADDAHPGSKPFGDLTMSMGLRIWRENVPLRNKPYRTVRLGTDLQLWFLEGREYRSRNDMADGSGKSIWGDEQKLWLEETLSSSTASFKIIFSPTPIVGPDRPSKKDNHANTAFRHEGIWARQMLSSHHAVVVSGDRHWQYVSRDSATGLWEFGSGPVSDYHAQGWPPDERRPEHRFLRVAGGFLGISLSYKNVSPALIFTHYDVDGNMTHQEQLQKKDIQYQ